MISGESYPLTLAFILIAITWLEDVTFQHLRVMFHHLIKKIP